MKKTKFAMLLVMVFVLALQGAGLMPAAAEDAATAASVNDLTVEYIFNGLGDALKYGVVAEEYIQGNHAETSVCVDTLIKTNELPFLNTETTYMYGQAYPLYATVSAPADETLLGMQFALFTANGDTYTMVEETIFTVTEDTNVTAVGWKLPEDSEALKETLYIRQVEERANGTYRIINEGAENSAELKVHYGPSVSTAAPSSSYIGSMVSDITYGSPVKFYNTMEHNPPIQLGEGVRLCAFTQVGFGRWDYVDITDCTQPIYDRQYNNVAAVYIQFTNSAGEVRYERFHDEVFYQWEQFERKGYFYYESEGTRHKLDITAAPEQPENQPTKVQSMLQDATAMSIALGNMTGGVVKHDETKGAFGSYDPDILGNSTVTGPEDENGNIVSLYSVELNDWAFDAVALQNSIGQQKILIAPNEYAVFNVICPAKDGYVDMLPGSLDMYVYAAGKADQALWGKEDSGASDRVLFNYVYWDESEQKYLPFEGTINPASQHGGTLLAPSAHLDVLGSPPNGASITKSVENKEGTEIHQRTMTSPAQTSWVNMLGDSYVTTGAIKIVKKNGTTGELLGGVEFSIYTDEQCTTLLAQDGIENPISTDATTGAVLIDGLNPGTYYVQESKPQGGYAANDKVYTVEVKAGVTSLVGTKGYVENFKGRGTLRIVKVEEGNDSVKLQGAVFKIYTCKGESFDANSETLLQTCTTNANGEFEIRLDAGDYWIKEIYTPFGYELDSMPIKVTVVKDEEALTGTNVVVTNEKMPSGTLSFTKVDADDNTKTLQDAEFGIYADAACSELLKTFKTAADGTVNLEMPVGTYYVQEITAPTNYKLDDTVHTVVIEEGVPTQIGNNGLLENEYGTGKLWLKKVEANRYPAKPLAGAWFGVYQDDVLITTGVTDDEGYLELEVPINNNQSGYVVKELYAPNGYVNSNFSQGGLWITKAGEVKQVEGDYWPGTGNEFNGAITNAKSQQTGRLMLYKGTWDLVPGEDRGNKPVTAIDGAVFGVYYDKDCTMAIDGSPFTTKSEPGDRGRKGFLEVNGLTPGTYYVKEEKAAPGYQKDNSVMEVNVVHKPGNGETRVQWKDSTGKEHSIVYNAVDKTAYATLDLTKHLDTGYFYTAVEDTFNFAMTFKGAKDAVGADKTTGYTIVDGEEAISFTDKETETVKDAFKVSFTEAGVYTFEVKEIAGDNTDYIVYDKSVYTVIYDVTEKDSVLSVQEDIYKGEATVRDVSFANTYGEFNIEGKKVWSGSDESYRLKVDEFAEKYLVLSTVGADGKLTKVTNYAINPEGYTDDAHLTVSLDEEDGHFNWNFYNLPAYDADGNALTYVVQELTVNGYQTFYVNKSGEFEDKTDGLYVKAPRPNATEYARTIHNVLSASELTIEKTVNYEGDAPAQKEFQFTITPAVGLTGYTIVDKDSNPDDGLYTLTMDYTTGKTATLAVDILFDNFEGTSKTFTFTVAEAGTAPAGWTYDTASKTVTYTVTRTEAGQQVNVTATGNTASFTNNYKEEEKTSVSIYKVWPNSAPQDISKYLYLCKLVNDKLVELNPQPPKTVKTHADYTQTYTWSDLPKYEADGVTEIKYAVIEKGLEGYFTQYPAETATGEGYALNGGTIFNRAAEQVFVVSKWLVVEAGVPEASIPTSFNFIITPGKDNPAACELWIHEPDTDGPTKMTPANGVYTAEFVLEKREHGNAKDMNFAVRFPQEGTYTFEVKEVIPDEHENWVYDTHVNTYTFKVNAQGVVTREVATDVPMLEGYESLFYNFLHADTELEIKKYWEDDSDAAGKRPDMEVWAKTLKLRWALDDGDTKAADDWEVYDKVEPTVSMQSEDNWVVTYENLPSYINGEKVTWSVVEADIYGYDAEYDGNPDAQWAEYTIDNTCNLVYVTVGKAWRDDKGGFDTEQHDVTDLLELYILTKDSDGKDVLTLVKGADGKALRPDIRKEIDQGDGTFTYDYTWSDLPKLKDGEQYVVKEDLKALAEKYPGWLPRYNSDLDGVKGYEADVENGRGLVDNQKFDNHISLRAYKWVDGYGPAADQIFTFELENVTTGKKQTFTNDGHVIDLKVEYAAADLPEYGKTTVYEYVLREVDPGDGKYIYDKTELKFQVTIDDLANVTHKAWDEATKDYTAPLDFDTGVEFHNKTKTSVSVTKVWNGGKYAGTTEPVTLTLYADGAAQTAKPVQQGNVYTWSDLPMYDEYGELIVYTVKETQVPDGYSVKYTAEVGEDGETTTTVETPDGAVDGGKIVNTYYKTEGEYVLEGEKLLEGRELKAGEFAFVLEENGKILQSVTNDADGTFAFDPIKYTVADVDYGMRALRTYYIYEVEGNLSGVTYDTTKYEIKLELQDNMAGEIIVTPYGGDMPLIVFTNTYEEKTYEAKGSIVLEGTKTLEGRALKDGEFEFELYRVDAKGETFIEKVANKAGKITFSEIKYTEKDAGKTYTYKVYEVDGKLPGVTYVKEPVTVQVAVTDNGNGTLTAALTGNSPAISFTNSYEAEGSVTFKGTKFLLGREFKQGDEFTFELLNEAGTVIDTVTITPESGAKADFAFKTIKYELADAGKTYTYTYRVKETAGSADGMTYDDTIHTVTVTVKDAGDGTLVATASPAADKLNFTNTYLAEGSVLFSGNKTMDGRKLAGKDFTFVLTDAEGKEIQTVTNDADGKIVFSAIQYALEDAGKTFTYKVYEVNDKQTAVTYDDTVYTVTVKVEDAGNGHLKVTASDNATKLNFTNSYEAKALLTMNAYKTVNGYKPTVDQVYDFVLLCDDGTEMMAQNKEETISFGALAFDEDDIGKTFIYTVKETTEANELLDVDAAIYQVAVTVSDGGDGNLKLETEILKDGKRATGVVFANTATATLAISKTVKGPGPDKAYDLKVTFIGVDGKELEGAYDYDGDVKGTITSGGVIALKDGQSVTIVGLPEGATYTVEENAGPAYTVTVNGKPISKAEGTLVGHGKLEFINTVEVTAFSVTKVWEGADLGEISLTLYADGKQITPQPEVTREGDKYTYYNLPKYNEEGEEIVYSAKERGIEGYIRIYNNVEPYQDVTSFVHDGGTIINREVEEEVHELSFKIRKVWTGVEANEEIPAITLTLYCNGEKMDVPTPKPDSEGCYRYYDLPKTVNGKIAVYTVLEESIPGFTVTYKTASGEIVEEGVNGGEITNAKIPQTSDPATLGLWLALMGASAALLAMLQRRRKA